MSEQGIIQSRKRLVIIRICLFALIVPLFSVPAVSRAADLFLPVFGEGKIKVRLYTDYFCPPCRDMQPGIEPVISELIKDRVIKLIFADTPFFRSSSLYVRYFLYAINEKMDFEHALYVRRSLIEAAKNNLDSAGKLETFLKEKKIALKPFDPKPTFDAMSRYLKEDRIESTPTCVIEIDGRISKHSGGADIINALNQLKKKKSEKAKESQ